jgi:hypothetical protein
MTQPPTPNDSHPAGQDPIGSSLARGPRLARPGVLKPSTRSRSSSLLLFVVITVAVLLLAEYTGVLGA